MLRRNTCRALRDLLPLHAGGDLPADEAARVDAHLHACLSCYREFRELAEVRGRLGVLAEEPLPAGILDGFTEEVMARIAVDAGGPAAELPAAQRWRPGPVFLRQAAAAALLLAVSAWMVWQADFGRGVPPAPARPGASRHEVVFAESAPPLADRPALPAAFPLHVPDLQAQFVAGGAGRPAEEPAGVVLRVLPRGELLRLLPAPADPTGMVPAGVGLVPEPERVLRPRER